MNESTSSTSTWCVYLAFEFRYPYKYVLQLVIKDVPVDEAVTEEMVEIAWGVPRDPTFDTPWANTRLARASDAPASIKGIIWRGDYENVPTISWENIREAMSCQNL